jgi:hypothetical protein
MRPIGQVSIEAIITGLIALIIFLVISLAHLGPLTTIFLTGVAFHFILEFTGGNGAFCDIYRKNSQ